MNTFAVFQTYYASDLLSKYSASEISWIGTFQAFLLVFLSLAVGPIFDRGYFRTLIIVGTILSVCGMMMLSLATEYWQVFLSQGVCVGLGLGCLFLPSVALVATYFTTKRALAIGIVAAGGSIGSVIYPIVFYRLQPRIGFPWATRVLAFIALATLTISISVMRTRLPPAKKARAVFGWSAFKNVPFSLFSFGLFLSFAGLYVPIFYIIIWAETHIDIDQNLSFYLLAVLNSSSIFGRIIPGLLADRFGSLESMIVCTLCSSILAYTGIVINTEVGLIVFAIFYGFLSGAVVSLPSAVVASLVPNLQLVGTWMAMSFVFAATGILIGNPIAGSIIKVSENEFSGGFIFSGSLLIGATAFLVAAKAIKFIEKTKQLGR